MFALSSEITIGGFRFSGVKSVRITKSVHSIVETASITIPSTASVSENGKVIARRTDTASQFKEGDQVTVKLGYNGALHTEFSGFVKKIVLGIPLTIECEGISWLLQRSLVAPGEGRSIKDILDSIVANASRPITIITNTDLALEHVSRPASNGIDTLKFISSITDGCMSAFFPSADVLWCGLLQTAVANGDLPLNGPQPEFRPGYNALAGYTLTPRGGSSPITSVEYKRRTTTGNTLLHIAGSGSGHTAVLNHISTADGLKLLAEEKLRKEQYSGLEGSFTAFLEPRAAPGQVIYLQHDQNSTRSGRYFVESTMLTFDEHGGRRKIEVGQKLK